MQDIEFVPMPIRQDPPESLNLANRIIFLLAFIAFCTGILIGYLLNVVL